MSSYFGPYASTVQEWIERRQSAAEPLAKPLSYEKVMNFFVAIANLDEMGWGFVRTSCFPKGYLMCEMALAEGIKPKKAWAFPIDGLLTRESVIPGQEYPKIKGEHPSGGTYSWDYHVALALPVTMPDGQIKELVFDPSLFDAPTTLEEWGQKMSAEPIDLSIVDYNRQPNPKKTVDFNQELPHTQKQTHAAIQAIEKWGSHISSEGRLAMETDTLPEDVKGRTTLERREWSVVGSDTGQPMSRPATHPALGRSSAKRAHKFMR